MDLNYQIENNFQSIQLNNFEDDAIKGNFTKNCLNKLFFSDQNIDALQLGLRNKIANITKGETIIGRQSDTELKIIMKGIYLLYGKNLDDNVVEQTRELNKKVLDYAVRRIMTEIEQYNNYVKDASSMHVPLDRSENVSNKGSKTLYRETLF